ncbi:hypothetical protein GCM10027061_22270 [Nesterenkonia suensis]
MATRVSPAHCVTGGQNRRLTTSERPQARPVELRQPGRLLDVAGLGDTLRILLGHGGAATRLGVDESLPLQAQQGFTDRCAGDPQPVLQFGIAQLLTGGGKSPVTIA